MRWQFPKLQCSVVPWIAVVLRKVSGATLAISKVDRTMSGDWSCLNSNHAVFDKPNCRSCRVTRHSQGGDIVQCRLCRPLHRRHTHASKLIDAGLEVVTVSRRLGHSTPTITLSVYADMFGDTDERAAEAVEAAMAKVLV
jgi:hypothetical protein